MAIDRSITYQLRRGERESVPSRLLAAATCTPKQLCCFLVVCVCFSELIQHGWQIRQCRSGKVLRLLPAHGDLGHWIVHVGSVPFRVHLLLLWAFAIGNHRQFLYHLVFVNDNLDRD